MGLQMYLMLIIQELVHETTSTTLPPLYLQLRSQLGKVSYLDFAVGHTWFSLYKYSSYL